MTKANADTDTTKQPVADVLKLSQLSIDPANVRKTMRGTEPKFAASIRRRGVLQPMIVRRSQNAGFLVTDGGERLAALKHLNRKGDSAAGVPVTDDFLVRVEIVDQDDASARAASLALNLIRSDIHPVDEFEAFAQMIQDGATVDEIAAENAMKVPEVRQALSLAAIAPEIRKAWRDGKIGGDAAEAYAQTKDLAHQIRVFNKLKGRAGEEWAVTQEIAGADAHNLGAMLAFVGQKEYEAAGHQVNASLFDDDERHPVKVNNVPALKAMTEAKLEAECDRLKKDGWGWAIFKVGAPNDLYAWRRLPHGTPTKEQKALAGCTVGINYNGSLEVERGYIKPGVSVKIEKTPAQKAAAKKAKSEVPDTGGISNALATRLSKQITLAAADALAQEGPLALRAAIAAIASADGPVRIETHGMAELNDDDRDEREFAAYLHLGKKKSQQELMMMLATWVAKSLNFSVGHANSLPLTGEGQEAEAALLNDLNASHLNAALRKRFDAAGYFDSVNKELCLRALAEALPKLSVNKSQPKAAIAKIAVGNVPGTKWLPPELRIDGYDGPRSKPEPKKAKAVARKKRS